MPAKEGDKVKVEYTGTFEDGEVFDSSEKHGQPLEFELGAKQVVPGFENAIVGMEKDEEKEVKIESKDAYGDQNPQLVQELLLHLVVAELLWPTPQLYCLQDHLYKYKPLP